MNITVDQILCLKAVYDEGSLTKAADKMNRAKSAINYSLNKLEEQLDFKLLDKSEYRPKLTLKGEEFLLKSRSLLKEHKALLDDIEHINSEVEMRLSLSISYNCESDNLYSVIKKAMAKYPSTEIKLHKEVLSGLKLLKDESVDIAIFEDIGEPVDYEAAKLGAFHFYLCIAKNHPFLELAKKEQTMGNLKKYPHIVMSSSINDSQLSRAISDDEIKWYVSDIHSKIDMISKGLGWGRIPSHFLGNKKIIHLKNLDDLRKIDYFICRQKDKIHGEVSQFIWESLTNS